MKLRMKKMPRPLDLRTFSGIERIANGVRIEALAFVEDLHDELFGPLARLEPELHRHLLVAVFPVAVLDGVDDRLADGHAHPVRRVLIQPGEPPRAGR